MKSKKTISNDTKIAALIQVMVSAAKLQNLCERLELTAVDEILDTIEAELKQGDNAA